MGQETIEGLLEKLDAVIVKRDRGYQTIDAQYKRSDGNVIAKQYDEYKLRKDSVTDQANKDSIDCQKELDVLCKKIRSKQPALIEMGQDNLNRNERFPRQVALGKYHVCYENLDFFVPKMFRFPFEKPMYIADDSQTELLHKILLRLMYALPTNKQEYYVFDPVGVGRSVWNFNQLFSNQKVFPQGKVMTNSAELKAALKDVAEYMSSLYSDFFSIENDCPDWDACNRRFYSQGNPQKMLPYKVFIFMDVPEEMDADCFSLFRKLMLHSRECGFLVLFSFNSVLLEAEDSKMRAQELQLRKLVDDSLPLHAVLDRELTELSFERLQVYSVGEKFPDRKKLSELLTVFEKEVEKADKSTFSFEGILPQESLFSESSDQKLCVPSGYIAAGGNELIIEIGDRTPHYLVGGTTGSGKSNFLHNLIVSASWHYSPKELQLYLLDFKEGVEFSRYASPALANAALVAIEADTEYGISVLRHLDSEKTRRYSKFKQSGCKDIHAYRKQHPNEPMPRILVVIDEFQVLFESNEREQTISSMTTLAKQGRACGIHMILATQTLKGVDFGSLGTQFSGRIALNCPAEDSKLFLGGITSNNEAAAELEIPYAILNIAQGNPSKNVKFAVPEAKSELIASKISEINKKAKQEGLSTSTKRFEGQKFPTLPRPETFRHRGALTLTLGEVLNYESEPLSLEFRPAPENNLLLCGRNSQMKQDFLRVTLLSALGCQDCDGVVYIGDDELPNGFSGAQKIVCYKDAKDFVDAEKGNYFSHRRLVILDNSNLARSIEFPPKPYGQKNDYLTSFMQFWEDANQHSTHIVAFYDGANRIKACGIQLTDFQYRIGFDESMEEYNYLLGNSGRVMKSQIGQRAFIADNQTITAWFRPYE